MKGAAKVGKVGKECTLYHILAKYRPVEKVAGQESKNEHNVSQNVSKFLNPTVGFLRSPPNPHIYTVYINTPNDSLYPLYPFHVESRLTYADALYCQRGYTLS